MMFAAALDARAQEAKPGDYGFRHQANHDWYKDLKRPGTDYSCCNGGSDGHEGDCRPTRAWQKADGTWMAVIDGSPEPVPPHTVLKQLAPDGGSHICASRPNRFIYCFIAGSPKS